MLYNTKPFQNYQLASITMQSSASRYYFPNLPQLRNVYTTGVVFYPPNVSLNDNNNFSSASSYTNSYVTFNVNGEEVIRQMELIRLITILQEGKSYPHGLTYFDNLQIDYEKSFVEIASGITPPTFPSCFMFGIYYTKNKPTKK